MILADIYTLFNDVFFELLRFIVILAAVVLAIFLGATLRKFVDRKKAAKENISSAIQDEE
ncbi:MAG: hypothetical protein ACI4EN_10330 [Butyrivibrio sp.]